MDKRIATRSIVLIGVAAALAAVATAVALRDRTEVAGQTPRQRIEAICRLADERPGGAADAIAAAADDQDPSVRRAAMVALGKFAADKYRGVIDAGTRDADPTVRSAAAASLGRLADDDAVARLGKVLAGDADERVRLAAVTGLARAGTDRAIVMLVETAEKDKSTRLRRQAMAALTSRYGIRFHNPPDPDDADAWSRAMGKIRRIPGVRKACGLLPTRTHKSGQQ